MARATLRSSDRVHCDARFDRIRRKGVRAGDDLLFVRALANGLGRCRLGLAVSKSAGGAVARTRMRRMLRAAFRLNKARLPAGLDLLLAPRRGALGAPLDELGESLVRLAGRAAGELESKGEAQE